MAKRERKNDLKGVVLDLEDLEFFLHSLQQQKKYLESLLKEGDDISVISSFPATQSRFFTLNISTEKLLQEKLFTPASSVPVSKILGSTLHYRDYSQIRNVSLSFGSKGKEDGQFDGPSGIAITPKNEIYICDRNNHQIQVLDSDGKFLFKFGSSGKGPGQFRCPMGITLDHKKQFVLIADDLNHRVQIFDLKGNFIRIFGSKGKEDGQFDSPRGITVDQKGNIYIADYCNHRIQIFDQNGNFLRKIESYGHGNGQLRYPCGIALLSTGEIVVSETFGNRLSIFDRNGNFLRHIAQNQLKNPLWICVEQKIFYFGFGRAKTSPTIESSHSDWLEVLLKKRKERKKRWWERNQGNHSSRHLPLFF